MTIAPVPSERDHSHPLAPTVTLHLSRWHVPAGPVDRALLDRARGPVLDIGCGPGRHVTELTHRGVSALGIDVLPEMIAAIRERGVPALHRSVFGDVPSAGSWQTALLLDGNIGIGGDPIALLRRVASLLGPTGRVLLEADEPGTGIEHGNARLEMVDGRSHLMPWSRVGADHVDELAAGTGLAVVEQWSQDGRWFAELSR